MGVGMDYFSHVVPKFLERKRCGGQGKSAQASYTGIWRRRGPSKQFSDCPVGRYSIIVHVRTGGIERSDRRRPHQRFAIVSDPEVDC